MYMIDNALDLSNAQAKAASDAAQAVNACIGAMLEASASLAKSSAERNVELAVTIMGAKTLKPGLPASREAGAPQWRRHFQSPSLLAAFGVGFCILFAFVGTFSYVNFVLARPPFGLGMMQIGFVYLVFAPSILTTPLAGRLAGRWGARGATQTGLSIAGLGVAMTLGGSIPLVLAGLAMGGVGTFLAQAVATGFVGRTAETNRGGGAGALYLASYFSGGVIGAAALGRLFEAWGWTACQLGALAALAIATALAPRFELRTAVIEPATT